jgi:hypothetical protein
MLLPVKEEEPGSFTAAKILGEKRKKNNIDQFDLSRFDRQLSQT